MNHIWISPFRSRISEKSCWPQLLSSEARLRQRHHIAWETSYNKCPGGTWSSWEREHQTVAELGYSCSCHMTCFFSHEFPMRHAACGKSVSKATATYNIVSWKKGSSTDKNHHFFRFWYRKNVGKTRSDPAPKIGSMFDFFTWVCLK